MSATTGGRGTAEEQKKSGGMPDICAIYKFYFYHLVDDDKKMREIYDECKSGKILCGACKQRCADMIEKFLAEHQKKLEKAKDKAKTMIEK
jgi:tryptophanyl-tRNA synthetase